MSNMWSRASTTDGPEGVDFEEVYSGIGEAAPALFNSGHHIQAVSIGKYGSGFGLRVVRNVKRIRSYGAEEEIRSFYRIPVSYVDTFNDVRASVVLPLTGPGSPRESSSVLEQERHRDVVCGLQVQNFDDDKRTGLISNGLYRVGTLGCFVRLDNGEIGILSNNHVLAGENRGRRGRDRILQPGSDVISPDDQIAILHEFVDLKYSSPNSTLTTAPINDVDAAVAVLDRGVQWVQEYLKERQRTSILGTATANLGDRVFKVGRTTALTFGRVTGIAAVVDADYEDGVCWFTGSIEITGENGVQFSNQGDSGSAIVNDMGEVVGILYSGNGMQTYACPIDLVLQYLNCSLV